MKRLYKTPKAKYVDFTYDEQVTATSSGVSLYGDPDQVGRCQQSSDESCRYFWTVGAMTCTSNPFSLRRG